MRSHRSHPVRSTILMLVPLAALVLVGCGGGSPTTLGGTTTSGDLYLSPDPLEGIPDSPPNEAPPGPGPRIGALAEALDLTEAQEADLRDAHAEFHAGIVALKEQVRTGELTLDEAKEEAALLREALEAELQVILTEEQYDELQEMRQNRHGPGRGHRHRHDRWHAWLEAIDADEAQAAAIKDALEALHADMHDLHGMVRNGEVTHEEAVSLAEELRAAFDAELQTILTADQYAALQELRPDCRRGSPE